jgi:hypothetical protein
MELSYRNMSRQYIFPKVQELQNEVLSQVQHGEPNVDSKAGGASETAGLLADLHTKIQEMVATEWWSLADMLVVRYNDQYFNFPPNAPTTAAVIGYPSFYLQMAGFNRRSYYPGWMRPSEQPPILLLQEDLELARRSAQMASACDAVGLDGLACSRKQTASFALTTSTGTQSLVNMIGVLLFGIACSALGFSAGAARCQNRACDDSRAGESVYIQIGE